MKHIIHATQGIVLGLIAGLPVSRALHLAWGCLRYSAIPCIGMNSARPLPDEASTAVLVALNLLPSVCWGLLCFRVLVRVAAASHPIAPASSPSMTSQAAPTRRVTQRAPQLRVGASPETGGAAA